MAETKAAETKLGETKTTGGTKSAPHPLVPQRPAAPNPSKGILGEVNPSPREVKLQEALDGLGVLADGNPEAFAADRQHPDDAVGTPASTSASASTPASASASAPPAGPPPNPLDVPHYVPLSFSPGEATCVVLKDVEHFDDGGDPDAGGPGKVALFDRLRPLLCALSTENPENFFVADSQTTADSAAAASAAAAGPPPPVFSPRALPPGADDPDAAHWIPFSFAPRHPTTRILKAVEHTNAEACGSPDKIALINRLRGLLRTLSDEPPPPPPPPPPKLPHLDEPAAELDHHIAARFQAAVRLFKVQRMFRIPVNETTLHTAFALYSNYAHRTHGASEMRHDMEGRNFIKMLKECNILGKQCTGPQADIIFAHHVKPGKRKSVDYDEWIRCLDEVGARMKIGPYGVKRLIVMGGGLPKSRGTTHAQHSRLHDDHSLYTGTTGRGGPSSVDADTGQISMRSITNRSHAGVDVRGVQKKHMQ